MRAKADVQRDRQVMRHLHGLFWRGNVANKWTFIGWLLLRPPAVFVYNILIPIQIAYGLQAIINRQFDQVMHHGVMIVVLALVYCVLWALGGLAICKNGAIGGSYVQRTVFANFLTKDHEFYNTTFIGSLSAQASRLLDAFNQYNQIMIASLPEQIIVVVASIAIIAYNSMPLALVTLVAMALVLSYTIASSRWRLRYRRKLSEASSELAGVVGDALGQASTVKSFASEDYERTRLDSVISVWARRQYVSWATSIPSDIGRMLLAAGAVAVLLVMTARLYQQHAISIAIIALVQLYVVKLITTTQEIADSIKNYENIMGSAYQATKTLLIEPTITDPEKPQKFPTHATMQFDDVTFRYADARVDKMAISNFTLDIAEGEKVGIVGYSGSGKTTLTKLLMRFMDITGGTIRIGGIDIRELSQHDLRSHISYVPQEPLLFHRSIMENIAYGNPSAAKKQVLAAAEAAYVNEFVDDLPKTYDTLVGERGVKLSGGQRQRVAIARAILKDAPILVLDEATSALDSRSERLIQQALRKLMKQKTAVVIAHRLSTIQRMDRIVVVDKGRIVQVGTHDELVKQKGIYAELWEHQSGGYIQDKPKTNE